MSIRMFYSSSKSQVHQRVLLVLLFPLLGLVEGWFFPKPEASRVKSVCNENGNFRDWCTSVGIKAPCLEHISIGGIPGVSVIQTSTLKAGDCAIVLPVKAAIIVLDNDHVETETNLASPIPIFLCDSEWIKAPKKLRLACTLLNEQMKGGESYYKGYIEHLPPITGPGRARCDTLDRWTEKELSLLHSPVLVSKTLKRAKKDAGWFTSLESGICTRDQFDWALDIVRTRAFEGDFSIPNNGEGNDIALLPFIDDLNHQETNAKYGKTFPTVAQSLGRTSKTICWVAQGPHKSGAEVAHSYLHGEQSIAEDFLNEWGFSPTFLGATRLNVKGLNIILRGDGRVEDHELVLTAFQAKAAASHASTKPSDREVWSSVAAACDTEADSLKYTNSDSDKVSQRREAIAQSFLEGKSRLLRKGSQWARCQEEIAKAQSRVVKL